MAVFIAFNPFLQAVLSSNGALSDMAAAVNPQIRKVNRLDIG
jgi:hypothetical protein